MEIERRDCIEACNNEEEIFHPIESGECEEESLKVLPPCMQSQLGNNDEERTLQEESQKNFIPSWCLNASNDDFLCGEDVLTH